LTLCFAVFFAYLEYYYILFDGLPYRNVLEPVLFFLHPYHIFPIIPALAFIAFEPLIHQYLFEFSPKAEKIGLFVLGLANFFQGLTTLDFFWFVFRVLAPSSTDPLAGQWIRAGEWTALSLGWINLFGFSFPAWYLITLPLSIPVYIAFLISR